jgi:hypothetical protein
MLTKKVCNFVLFCDRVKSKTVEREVITLQFLQVIKMQAFTSCKVSALPLCLSREAHCMSHNENHPAQLLARPTLTVTRL